MSSNATREKTCLLLIAKTPSTFSLRCGTVKNCFLKKSFVFSIKRCTLIRGQKKLSFRYHNQMRNIEKGTQLLGRLKVQSIRIKSPWLLCVAWQTLDFVSTIEAGIWRVLLFVLSRSFLRKGKKIFFQNSSSTWTILGTSSVVRKDNINYTVKQLLKYPWYLKRAEFLTTKLSLPAKVYYT